MLSLGYTIAPSKIRILPPLKQKPLSSISTGLIPRSKRNESNHSYPHLVSIPKFHKIIVNVATEEEGYHGEERKNDVILKEEQLPAGLEADLMPKHVAVIMDGNRRWALQRDLPVSLGHEAGRKALGELGRACTKLGVKVLTVYAFSTENWSRPKEEVDLLMQLIEDMWESEMEKTMGRDIRASVIGNRSMLPISLTESIGKVEETAKAKPGLHFIAAVNYGGRYDILQACKGIAYKVKNGLIQPEDINESLFGRELETKCIPEFPNPDLLIRTSGELRLSNFLLWQLAHSELFFVDKLFPDFSEGDFVDVLISYQKRRIFAHEK